MSTSTIEINVRPAAASFAKYLATKADLAAATPEQIVELTFAYHSEWQSSPERKAEREQSKAAKAEAAAQAKADREAKRAERDEANREKVLAAAKRLGIVPSDVVKEAPKK